MSAPFPLGLIGSLNWVGLRDFGTKGLGTELDNRSCSEDIATLQHIKLCETQPFMVKDNIFPKISSYIHCN